MSTLTRLGRTDGVTGRPPLAVRLEQEMVDDALVEWRQASRG